MHPVDVHAAEVTIRAIMIKGHQVTVEGVGEAAEEEVEVAVEVSVQVDEVVIGVN